MPRRRMLAWATRRIQAGATRNRPALLMADRMMFSATLRQVTRPAFLRSVGTMPTPPRMACSGSAGAKGRPSRSIWPSWMGDRP